MAMRIRKTSVVWLTIASVMFGISIWLTYTVTWIEPDPVEANTYSPEKSPFQIAAVFTTTTPTEANKPFEYSLLYDDEIRPGTGRLTFFVRLSDGPIILLSSPAAPSCFIVNDARDPDPAPSESLGAAILDNRDTHQKVYRLQPQWPAHADDQQAVRCYVKALSRFESFTERVADFYFDDAPPPDALDARPVPQLTYRSSRIAGARNLAFRGGVEPDETTNGRDEVRLLRAGSFMSVHWQVANRLGLRDTLLILIGTLIGIGVTVLIEGVRPYLEGLEHPDAPVTAVSGSPSEPPASTKKAGDTGGKSA